MNRYVVVLLLCLASPGAVMAGEPPRELKRPTPLEASVSQSPASHAQSSRLFARRKLEARLQAPAELDFGRRQRVSAREVLDQLHAQHHLSIRFDVPTFAALFGDSAPGSIKKTDGGEPPPTAYYMRDDLKYFPPGPEFVRAPVAVSAPVAIDAPPVSVAAAPVAIAAPVPVAAPVAPSAVATSSVPATALPPAAAPAAANAPTPLSTDHSTAPRSESKTEPVPQSGSDAGVTPAKAPDTRESLEELLRAEFDIQTVDLKDVSIATVLRLALDAAPLPSGAEEFGGLPIPLTNAMLLDYLVEDDGLLITTRMKALTQKETRVYSVKHLHELPPEQLARTIRQAVRPWSWRLQITDLGEQLKGNPLPAETIGSLLKTGVQLVGADLGATVTTADDAKPATDKSDNPGNEAQASVMLGNAMVNSLVTFVQATLATLEMFHYAEPPTATIQTLSGKLVITQSQAAHHEIAELLSQLGEE